MTDQKQQVCMPDGKVLELGSRQVSAIIQLIEMLNHVADGATHSLAVAEIVGAAREAHWKLISISGEGLDQLSDVLLEQSKMARRAAASWQGTPSIERSYLEH